MRGGRREGIGEAGMSSCEVILARISDAFLLALLVLRRVKDVIIVTIVTTGAGACSLSSQPLKQRVGATSIYP